MDAHVYKEVHTRTIANTHAHTHTLSKIKKISLSATWLINYLRFVSTPTSVVSRPQLHRLGHQNCFSCWRAALPEVCDAYEPAWRPRELCLQIRLAQECFGSAPTLKSNMAAIIHHLLPLRHTCDFYFQTSRTASVH